MLKYKINKNKTYGLGDEIVFDDFFNGGDFISGTVDYYSNISDGQKVIVKNSRSLIDKEMTMNVSESKRQGWLNYLKKCEIQHIEKIYDDNENAVNLAYIEFNNIFIPQKTEITYSDTETSIKLFNVFDIPNNGKYTFSDEDKFVRIKQKCYIDDGIVGADGIEYYNHLDFELSDKGNFDEKIGMYKDYLPIDGISHELYYYPKEKYYNVYKCVISNSDEEDITFTVSDIYCASPYRYIIYKDNNYDIYSGTNSDGKSFDSISLENNKYYYVDNGNISKFYDSYDDAYSDVIDKGLDESTIYKKTDLKTEISFQDRKYSDFFYNDGIYPSFETEYTKMLNGEDYSLEGSDNIYIKTKNTASDKDLEIVQPSDLDAMLRSLPECKGVLTAGQLATEVFMRHYDIKKMPKMGQSVDFIFDNRLLKLYRMPSSSRAYPMQLEKKAEFYRVMFDELI